MKNEILTKEEREYLDFIIKPFRYKVTGIMKSKNKYECILIAIHDDVDGEYKNIALPCFEKGAMYKGMDSNWWYQLNELGLDINLKCPF